MADAKLLGAVAAGEIDAQRELMDRLWTRVHKLSRYLCRDPVESEDLAQEALLQILGAAKGFRAQGCLEAWADVITVRTIKHRLRRQRWTRYLTGTALEQVPEALASTQTEPEQQARQHAREGRLGELLGRLNDRQHTALMLKVVHGYTVDEVADLMEESPATVRYLVRKGRQTLRKVALKDPALLDLLAERRS